MVSAEAVLVGDRFVVEVKSGNDWLRYTYTDERTRNSVAKRWMRDGYSVRVENHHHKE